MNGSLRGPFDEVARLQAGFTAEEIADLNSLEINQLMKNFIYLFVNLYFIAFTVSANDIKSLVLFYDEVEPGTEPQTMRYILNKQFLRIENDLDIIKVLKNTQFVQFHANQFQRINDNNMFFKSDKINKLFGTDYFNPHSPDYSNNTHVLTKQAIK